MEKNKRKMKLKNCFEVRFRYQTFNQKEISNLKEKLGEVTKNNFLLSSIRLPVKTKRVTLLRSPHVNKKSRDQLEIRFYNGVIFLRMNSLCPVFLETIKNLFIPQMSIKISIVNFSNQSQLKKKWCY